MLHELLLALLGHTGGLVVSLDDVFRINPTLEVLSPQERTVLDQLLALGSFYTRIKQLLHDRTEEFLGSVFGDTPATAPEHPPLGNSIYMRALCEVVQDALEHYENEVLAVEEEYLRTRVCNFGQIAVRFSSQYLLLPEIIILFEYMEENNLKGGKLLEFSHEQSRHGSEVIRQFYQTVSNRLYQVLASQVITWLLYGKIEDAFGEFFICKNAPANPRETIAIDDYPAEDEDWNSTFGVRISMLPRSLIPMVVANKILFIGKYVRVVTRARNDVANSVFNPDILRTINSLAEYDFSGFQEKIETIRAEAGKQFLSLFLREENIMDHLTRLKDYYFLGRGEFFQMFIEESQGILKLPPKHFSENDLNNKILPSVLMKLNWSDAVNQKLLSLVRFSLTPNGFEYKELGNTLGLAVGGNIETGLPNMIRFKPQIAGPTAASIFHTATHNISSGFELKFSFKFQGFADRSVVGLSPLSEEARDRVLTPTLDKLQPVMGCNSVGLVIQSGIDPQSSRILIQCTAKTH